MPKSPSERQESTIVSSSRARFSSVRAYKFRRIDCRRLILWKLQDLRNEPVPSTRHGHDIAMIVNRLAQRSSKDMDVLAEIAFLYKRIGPHHVHEVVLRDYFTSLLNENREDVEGLRGKLNDLLPL